MTQSRVSSDDFDEEQDHPLAVRDEDTGEELIPQVVFSDDTEDDSYDLESPILKVLQRTSPEVEEEEGKAGELYVDGYGLIEAPAIFIPMGRAQTRIMKEDPDDIDSDIVCRSPNAFKGYGDPGGDCSQCPFSRGTQEQAPACSHIITFIGYLPEHDMPVRTSFQRTSLRAARRINTLLKGHKMGEVAIKMTSRPAGTARQRYHTPVVGKAKMPEDIELPDLKL